MLLTVWIFLSAIVWTVSNYCAEKSCHRVFIPVKDITASVHKATILMRYKSRQFLRKVRHKYGNRGVNRVDLKVLSSKVSDVYKVGHICLNPLDGCNKKINWDRSVKEECTGLIVQIGSTDVTIQLPGLENDGRPGNDCYDFREESAIIPQGIQQYQLIEIVHLPGQVDIHKHDYSYRPVATLPLNGKEKEDGDDWWWDDNYFYEDDYQRMGDQAFAGGSNGDVWKAKRRCHQLAYTMEYYHQHPRAETSGFCDESQIFVMKRIKVGTSYKLLEAGLREIYFGTALSKRSESIHLFTNYVDHFFHRGLLEENLELWIIFKDAGPSLRSLLYTAIDTGEFVVYQHSDLWIELRTENPRASAVTLFKHQDTREYEDDSPVKDRSRGKDIFKTVVKQLLTSASNLHENGIIHRDIKPSNIMCQNIESIEVKCVLGDLSSAYDKFTADHLYSDGPSIGELTDTYAPPEVLFSMEWTPFYEGKPESYDSWSIGVTLLEMLLGTPNVFSIDKRTTQILTNKMLKVGASKEDIRKALYLASLSQFCIYVPTTESWPLRPGDPLFQANIVKSTCTLKDFHYALRARDPLGIGFDESINSLLQLILDLLSFDPKTRMTAKEALNHPYVTTTDQSNALEPQMLDPKIDIGVRDIDLHEFICPKCGRTFDNLHSCQMHARGRNHARFCNYDRSRLPLCLNAHSMLPSHPTSGYCDIQGRRKVIEDFHTLHLYESHQFYGVFDGHNGALAAKYASATLYGKVIDALEDMDNDARNHPDWKLRAKNSLIEAFRASHLGVVDVINSYPREYMSRSGTTATALLITKENIIVAGVGDSRAVLSLGASFNETLLPEAMQLTVDHIASDPNERERVESLGGFISVKGGTMRVNGTLVLTRSFGDIHMDQYLSRIPSVMIMSKKEVQDICKSQKSDEMPCFIILASDGLWDVFTNEDAVELVTSVLQTYGPEDWKERAFQKAAEVLTQEAFVRGSADNIGVCVVAV